MKTQVDLSGIPESLRGAFHEFASAAVQTAGANLLALTAYGGRRLADPAFASEPLASVMMIYNEDLLMLERLGERGLRFGRHGIAAPLVMTPDYLRASLDSFPLELLEIQQTGRLVFGQDYFELLRFERRHMRLQCERELKSIKLHLRQGLLESAGRRHILDRFCQDTALRTVRVLRGWLHIHNHVPTDQRAINIVMRAAMALNCPLSMLEQAVTSPPLFDSQMLAQLYAEIKQISNIVDQEHDD
jgi:hypothetical protein